jgi:hypothetical protein
MRRPSVDPAFTFAIALVMSLVLWWGTLRALLAGNVDITVAGMRYLAALALSWCGVYFIASLVAMYASQSRAPRPAEQQLRRRRTDATDDTTNETPAA